MALSAIRRPLSALRHRLSASSFHPLPFGRRDNAARNRARQAVRNADGGQRKADSVYTRVLKLLVFSDIHNDWMALERLMRIEADYYFAAGDQVTW